ncbi:MAG: glycosyl transferase family protein [Rhizobiales bacterium]|nr:glycosyl transferase family protein [Hyphomicrobiales bacterium]
MSQISKAGAGRTEAATGKVLAFEAPHPFAAYLRIIGRGATIGRALDETEAEAAFDMILNDEVDALQLGAFLLVLRYRTEAPSELAGFVRAARRYFRGDGPSAADLDWPSYADRHKQLPYFVLAAKLLAGAGIRVLMHGIKGEGPATTRAGAAVLGIESVSSFDEVNGVLDRENIAYLPLEALCPKLDALFALRPLLGLRTPVNSLARELNPGNAPAQMQGVFHPTYLPLHGETALLLGQQKAMIFKGGGGEAQRNPDKPCRAVMIENGASSGIEWPALATGEGHPWRNEPLDVGRLAALWTGDREDTAPVQAVIGSAAMALLMLGRAMDREEADAIAAELWAKRRRSLG